MGCVTRRTAIAAFLGAVVVVLVAGTVAVVLVRINRIPPIDAGWVSDDGLTLLILTDGCAKPITFTFEETTDQIIVDPKIRRTDEDCGGSSFDVLLTEPLGDRTVIDARNGDAIEISNR